MSEHELLSMHNLKTHFFTEDGIVRAVDGVDLEIASGDIVGLAGESGCGKSTLSLSLLRLVPRPGRIVSGEILFNGENLLEKSEGEMRKVRGEMISMIFQEPTTSLNPVITIGNQIMEAIVLHQKVNKTEALKRTIDMLGVVRIPDAVKVVKQYPFELSGGMQQRAMIAMALSCRPQLLIADEPTTSLDVTTAARVLELMRDLMKDFNTSILYVSHNLAVICQLCKRVAIMYAGDIVEFSSVEAIFKDPKHPYTRGLMDAIPRLDEEKDELFSIPGNVPNLIDPPEGCKFHPRCPFSTKRCGEREPPHVQIGRRRMVQCWTYY